jgi:hypothetical protein
MIPRKDHWEPEYWEVDVKKHLNRVDEMVEKAKDNIEKTQKMLKERKKILGRKLVTMNEHKSGVWDSGLYDDILDPEKPRIDTEMNRIRTGYYANTTRHVTKKVKKGVLQKMASKSGGISIGTILFWGWIIYAFVLDDDDDTDTPKTAEPQGKPKVEISEKINEGVEKVKEGFDKIVIGAKEEFEKAKEDGTLVTVNPEVKPKPVSDDPFGSGDDKYGEVDDKW